MVKTTVYLEAEDYNQLRQWARARGKAPAAAIREAIAEFNRKQRKTRLPRIVGAFRSGLPDVGQRAEEFLKGFGEQ
ncbi:MAG TPA: hypothetical protein VN709_03360 [Terriglobales bacterium]|nr:hypothetical protein [Terriglobales bacterium]